MGGSQTTQIIEIINVTEKTWLPTDTPQAITYFSVNDEWVYYAELDNKACGDCTQHDFKTYLGTELRAMFPFLEVDGVELISPHIHPNCRCKMYRVNYYGDVGQEAQ